MENLINKWNGLNSSQKCAFGDRFITHETNLNAWNKNFDDLSELKKKRVIENIGDINPENLNFVKGSGIS